MIFRDLFKHLLVDLTDQVFQTHHTAFTCFKCMTIFSVYGTKSQEYKIQIITDDLCLSCTAEYLFKVKRLSFIHNIDNLIRIDFLTAHHQCCKICCIVKRSTV